MMQPVPGLAAVRGFARATGTIVAGCAGLTIMAVFGQSYVLSAAVLAIRVSLCAFVIDFIVLPQASGYAILMLAIQIARQLVYTTGSTR